MALWSPESKEEILCADEVKETYTKRLGKHEHRLVAEEKLGRPLRKGEVVHHIDGDYKNNDPNNLMILPSQREHVKLHSVHKEVIL